MKFPETDPETYRGWAEEEWHDYTLKELGKLLKYVRKTPISGLAIGKIRREAHIPFKGKDLYNREVSLLMGEIEAYNEAWRIPVDKEKLERGWKLSGLKQP